MSKEKKILSSEDYDTFMDMEEYGYDENEIINELGLNKNEFLLLRRNIFEDV